MLSAQIPQRHARLGLLDKSDDLLCYALALSSLRHSPDLKDSSAKLPVRYGEGRSTQWRVHTLIDSLRFADRSPVARSVCLSIFDRALARQYRIRVAWILAGKPSLRVAAVTALPSDIGNLTDSVQYSCANSSLGTVCIYGSLNRCKYQVPSIRFSSPSTNTQLQLHASLIFSVAHGGLPPYD